MNFIKNNFENQTKDKWIKNKYFVLFFLNLFFLLAAFIFSEIKYEVSDDFVMETIVSGAYGQSPNPHMLFVNVLYGYLLKPAYLLFPGVNWYTVSLLFWGCVACMGLAYFLCNSLECKAALFFDILFLTAFTNDIYVLLQFTKTAAICCGVGVLLFFHGLFGNIDRKDRLEKVIVSKSEFIWGVLLCIIGSWIRMNIIYLVAPFILVIAIYECVYFFCSRQISKRTLKKFINKILIGVGMIAVVFGCYALNRISYKGNAEYSYYQKYAKVRSDIVDSPDYGYEEYEADLEKIGISENDYLMLRSWNFSDPEYFTLEKLEKVSEIIDAHRQWEGWQRVYERIQQRNYSSYPICLACIVLFIICLLWNISKWGWYFASVIPAGGLILYFFIRERILYRLEYGIFTMIFLILIYFGVSDLALIFEDKKKYKAAIIISICCMGLHLPVYIPDSEYKLVQIEERKIYIDDVFDASWKYDARKYRKVVGKADLSEGLIKEINEHPENVYLLDFNTTIQSLYYDWSAFDSLGVDYYKNFAYLSGVTMNFPDVNWCMKKMGISNPIKDLTKDGVYLVDNVNAEKIVKYLQEHYYPNAELKWEKNVEGYDIWKIVKE